MFFVIYLTTLSVHFNYMAYIEWMALNNELGRMWKEAVVANFELISWHCPGRREQNHGKRQSGQRLLEFSSRSGLSISFAVFIFVTLLPSVFQLFGSLLPSALGTRSFDFLCITKQLHEALCPGFDFRGVHITRHSGRKWKLQFWVNILPQAMSCYHYTD